jgi:PAS domain S-box-containing protein
MMNELNPKYFTKNPFIHKYTPGIIVQDHEARVMYANPESENMLGLSLSQLQQNSSLDIYIKAIKLDGSPYSASEMPFHIAKKTGTPVNKVVLGIKHPASHEYKWLSVSVFPKKTSNNESNTLYYTFLTEVFEVEEQKPEEGISESILNSFANNLPGMAYRCKADENWTMIYVSQRCEELTGYPANDLLGNTVITFNDIIHPDDREDIRIKVWEAIRNDSRFVLEYRIITADRSVKLVKEKGKAVCKNGKPLFIEGYIEDITDQKNTEIELKEKESALANALNGVAFTDLSGRITYVNNSFFKLWKFETPDEWADNDINAFCKSCSNESIIHEVLQHGEWQGEVIEHDKNGDPFHLMLSASLINGLPNQPPKLMFSFVDITHEKKLKENLKQKLEIEKTISFVSSRFVGFFDLDQAIDESLRQIGKINGASRVYVFRFTKDGFLMNNTHEWCNVDVAPQIDILRNIPVTDFPWWMEKLRNHEIINVPDVSSMPAEAKAEKKILQTQNIKSLLVIPLFIQDELNGFVGFDFTVGYRKWTRDDLTLLQMVGNILSNAISRKETETRLIESEKKFRHVFENHKAAKLLIDPDKGLIINANLAASELLGWSIPELLQMPVYKIARIPFKFIESGIHRIREEKTFHGVIEVKTKNGNTKFLEVTSSLIHSKEEDIIHTILFDVSDKKEIEQSLDLINLAVEQSPESIVITNRQSEIIYANPMFFSVTGYTREEIIGNKASFLQSGFHTSDYYLNLWDTILSGKNWYGEILNKKKNGELFWEYLSISPLMNSKNKITHFVAIKQDITEKKKNREELIRAKLKAEESDRLKSAFLANMSHEIRTPMNGILGFINLLDSPDLEKELQKGYIEIVKKSGKRLLDTINDIIEVSKIEQGEIEVNSAETDVEEIMQYQYSFFQLQALEKGLQLELESHLTGDNAFIHSDPHKLNSILGNLLRNAIKFTTRGSVKFGNYIENGNLVFFVRDTGKGIPPDRLEAIFHRFVHADMSLTRAHEGSGLGLSISKAYAEVLGGKIWVESTMGKGSTFFVIIPYNRAEFTFNEAPAPSEYYQDAEMKTILIAEDDDFSFMYFQSILSEYNYNILRATDGQSAIDLYNTTPDVSLILMDIKMPVMDGLTATRKIRKTGSLVPVIAQTAYALAGDKEKAIDAGCNEYLTKPVKAEDLIRTVEKYLGTGTTAKMV